MGAVSVYQICSCNRSRKSHEKNMIGTEIGHRKPRSAHTIAKYFKNPSDLQVEENCIGPFDHLGGDQGSHQEKTRLHPTPTGPGRCPTAPICVVSIAKTYYKVTYP